MGPRTRKAVAALGVLAFLTFYVWLAVTIGDHVPDLWWAKAVYFAVVGTAWGLPILPLIGWAERGGRRDGA